MTTLIDAERFDPRPARFAPERMVVAVVESVTAMSLERLFVDVWNAVPGEDSQALRRQDWQDNGCAGGTFAVGEKDHQFRINPHPPSAGGGADTRPTHAIEARDDPGQ
jgi:hypothetical protein